MSNRLYLVASATLFFLVALAHLYRLLTGLTVTVADFVLPMYVSWIAVIVPGALSASAVNLLRKSA